MSNPRFHMSVLKNVAANDYVVTDEELGELVSTKHKAGSVNKRVGDDYFRVLVKRSQTARSESTEIAGSLEADLAAIETAHKGMLAVVTATLITPEIKADPSDSSEVKAAKTAERQSRTKFASTAKSVLVRYVKATYEDGDLPGLTELSPADTGKSKCEAAAKATEAAAREANGENTPEGKVAKRLASLITALNQIEDDGVRRAKLVEVLNTLQASVS